MSDNARRERDAALAALESHPGADESVVAHAAPVTIPPTAPPSPPAARGPSAGTVVAGGGVLALLAAADQMLQQHGTTLADLTMHSGPLFGSFVANGPLFMLGVWALYSAWRRWQEDRAERVSDRAWAQQRALAQDRNARAQVRAIRAVAEEIVAVRGDLAAQAAIAHDHAGRLDRVESDVRDLRGRMPERRKPATHAPD